MLTLFLHVCGDFGAAGMPGTFKVFFDVVCGMARSVHVLTLPMCVYVDDCGLIGSEENYSIKSMEALYGLEREGEVKTAGGSVVAYERWRETSDQKILDEINMRDTLGQFPAQLRRSPPSLGMSADGAGTSVRRHRDVWARAPL